MIRHKLSGLKLNQSSNQRFRNDLTRKNEAAEDKTRRDGKIHCAKYT